MIALPAQLPARDADVALFYDAAKTALAAALRTDDAIAIRDRASRVKYYARQAKDRELLANAIEIKLRAERRLGQMLLEAESDGVLAQGGRRRTEDLSTVVTLAEIGVNGKLSMIAKAAGRLSDAAFESSVTIARQRSLRVSAARAARPVRGEPAHKPILGVDLERISFGQIDRLKRQATTLLKALSAIDAAVTPPSMTTTVREALSPQRLSQIIRDAEEAQG